MQYKVNNLGGCDVLQLRYLRGLVYWLGDEKIFTASKSHHHITTESLGSIKMSSQDLNSYVTHLPKFKVVVCHFCEECIPPKAPLDHYELNHTATKAHPVPMEIRRKIQDYMVHLNLCDPKRIVSPNR